MSAQKGIPPWAWIGCGCAGALGALLVLALAVGLWTVNKARELGESMADPVERHRRAVSVLGAEELPHGYHPVIALSIPFVLDVAVLSDLPPDERGRPPEIGREGFLYVSFAALVQQERELRDFFEGKDGGVEILRQQRMDVDLEERVARGTLHRSEDEILWVSHRGRVDVDDAGRSGGGLVTLMLIECDDDDRSRLGVWFGPDPSPAASVDELGSRLRGTVADPDEIERFLAPLHPCRGS